MNSPSNVTKPNLVVDAHRGLLLLKMVEYLRELEACQHERCQGNPNSCQRCIRLCNSLSWEAEYLMLATHEKRLFHSPNR